MSRIGAMRDSIPLSTSHLGKNPVRGGKPPKDSKSNAKITNMNGLPNKIDEKILEELIFTKKRYINKIKETIK